MKEYKIYLDEFIENLFYEMERVQDGGRGHIVMIKGKDKKDAAIRYTERLIPFFMENIESENEE